MCFVRAFIYCLGCQVSFTCWARFVSLAAWVLAIAMASPVDAQSYTATLLHPTGSDTSFAARVSGGSQVGYAYGALTGGKHHALLWGGTAASVVDLHPVGFRASQALGVSGASQVGAGITTPDPGDFHALLWGGTAESVVDLHPAGFSSSQGYDVSGGSQVGTGSNSGVTHALLWNGTAASVVDLHPVGFSSSFAYGVSDGRQVGKGNGPTTGNSDHALLWNGTAASVIDLHPFLTGLGASFTASQAFGIADNGSIVGWATVGNSHYAVLWTLVPEPTSAALVLMVAAGLASSRRAIASRREFTIRRMPESKETQR